MKTIGMKFIFFIFCQFIFTSFSIAQNFWTHIAHFDAAPACFAFDSSGNIYMGTLDLGVYFSSDHGDSWVARANGLTDRDIYSLAITGNGYIFAGTISHGVFYTSNQGVSWFQSALNEPYKINSIVISGSGTIFAGTRSNGIYRSTNNGITWIKKTQPPNVFSMSVSQAGYIVAGYRDPNSIFVSTDDGVTWDSVYEADHTINSMSSCINGKMYAVTGDFESNDLIGYSCIRSDNYGLTWDIASFFSNSSFGMTVNSLGHIFVGKYSYVMRSTNGGANWSSLNGGIDSSSLVLIALACSRDGYLFAGRQGGDLFRSTQSTIGIRKLGSDVPPGFHLYQNYPNPFNPSTKIRFDLPLLSVISRKAAIETRLEIFDLIGRLVAVLLKGRMGPGYYEIEWDGLQFSSGIYFYKLTYGSLLKSLPMVLVK